MYDWKGCWIEQDDPEPFYPRCERGHFLPRNPMYVGIITDEGRILVPYKELETLPQYAEFIWHCKCGSDVSL